MNYLAHAYLSFGQPGILAGNLFSDFIKGKKKFDFPAVIQQGIQLHRDIDQFTDKHESIRQAKEIFRKPYRLYSGAFTDVAFDHFLATDPIAFTESSLYDFSRWVYNTLDSYWQYFPESFHYMYPHMKEHNWLYNYRLRSGMEKSFGGLVRKAAYLTESETAFRLFEDHYDNLGACYQSFFPELKIYAIARLQEIQSAD